MYFDTYPYSSATTTPNFVNEKSFNKKPNRYPKKSLENYLNRDETMKDKVQNRANQHQVIIDAQMKMYLKKRLNKGFKSLQQVQQDNYITTRTTNEDKA